MEKDEIVTKIIFIIPYRDRKEEYILFLKKMNELLSLIIKYVPLNMRSFELCLAALKKNHHLIQYIPTNHITQQFYNEEKIQNEKKESVIVDKNGQRIFSISSSGTIFGKLLSIFTHDIIFIILSSLSMIGFSIFFISILQTS